MLALSSSALADIATLGVAKEGKWIDPSSLLVFGGPDVVARLATFDPSFRWGQRAAVYDRASDAHPAFSDAAGHGTGALGEVVEDPGEFIHVGELRDGMDLARKRLGIVAVPGEVRFVETAAPGAPPSSPWDVDAKQYPVRVRASVDGTEVLIYAEYLDLTTGPGKPRMPNEQVLSEANRERLLDEKRGGVLFSGEKLLEGKNVSGKRVLVLSFGPTGAWAAITAAHGGAVRVDFAGGAGGELGTGARKDDNASNDAAMRNMASLDRLQDVIDGNDKIHVTLDRIIHIEPKGDGALVTYAHGPGENAELYQVEYDAIASSMGYTTADNAPHLRGENTVKEMIGDMQMVPQRGTEAPVLEDAKTGRVRVMGFAAGDATNVSRGSGGNEKSERARFEDRGRETSRWTSADSPDHRVVEGAGDAIRTANEPGKGTR